MRGGIERGNFLKKKKKIWDTLNNLAGKYSTYELDNFIVLGHPV